MTEHEPTQAATDVVATERVRGPRVARAALVFAATTAIVVSAAVALGASPSADPDTDEGGSDPSAGVEAAPAPAGAVWLGPEGTPGAFLGPIGHRLDGRFEITVQSVEGEQVSLRTENGWSRTVDATGVPIGRGDEEIALSELQVGEQVVLQEERNDDGTWTVTAIHVVQPHAGGVVTDVGSDTITVERRDGTSTTIAVTDETTYMIPGVDDPGFDDIAVDDLVFARGMLDADGTLVASDIWGGIPRGAIRERLDDHFEDRFDGPFQRWGRGPDPGRLDGPHPWLGEPDVEGAPDVEAAPDGSTDDEEETDADGASS